MNKGDQTNHLNGSYYNPNNNVSIFLVLCHTNFIANLDKLFSNGSCKPIYKCKWKFS